MNGPPTTEGQATTTVPLTSTAHLGFWESMQIYRDWRMAKILLLGLISGFPWVLIASLMSLWLKDEGLTRTGIGLFGIVFTVYAFNMFWAPLVDRIKLPLLHRFGQRRSWIILMQSFIAVLIVMLSTLSPSENLISVSIICFLIALFSATQDVAVDAMRIELMDKAEPGKVGAGSAMATIGWWLGFGAMGSVALFLADYLDTTVGIENFWQITYLCMVVVVILSVIGLLVYIDEPTARERLAAQDAQAKVFSSSLSTQTRTPLEIMTGRGGWLASLVGGLLFAMFSFQYLKGHIGGEETPTFVKMLIVIAVWPLVVWLFGLVSLLLLRMVDHGYMDKSSQDMAPLKLSLVERFYSVWYLPVSSFVRNYGVRVAILVITLVFFFKIGEAFLGRMSIIFYKEVGFSKSDIALYSKGFGTLALCVFSIFGGLLTARYGLFRGLLVGGIAMASTNLLFSVLAVYPEKWLFALAVITDQFTTAVSTVALVAFLSQLCDRTYTATQYAALASLGNFSRTTLAIGSGAVVDGLGGNWSLFFIITTLMVLPSLALLIYIRKDIKHLMDGQQIKLL